MNEILRATLEHKQSGGEFIYSPKVYNKSQEKFHELRYLQIKSVINSATFEKNKIWTKNKNHKIFAWNADYETKEHGSSLVANSQNRLFSILNFTVLDSFSNFRKKAEKSLPNYFEDAIEPYDDEVCSRIQHYFYDTDLPSNYFNSRNGMVDLDDSSRFSPYLACGALDVRFLYNEIKKYEQRKGGNKSTYWLVFELLWREFFFWHYQLRGTVYFSQQGINGPNDFSEVKIYSIQQLKKMSTNQFWLSALKELDLTGFQTNRTRQLFASFWIHELGLNWRSGAILFENHLIDYDVYSNWGNWMYISGVGASSRGARKFNIESQLERYDPQKKYLAKWA